MTAPTPPGNGLWPPRPFNEAQDATRVWNAWYTGDHDQLTALYVGKTRPAIRPSQYSGGVVGAASRFWWGKPQNGHQPQRRIHVPLPADIATVSADLLFSEPPRIVAPGEDGDTSRQAEQQRLEDLVNTPHNYAALLEAAEVQSALGGTYLSLTWDADIADHPLLVPQDADAAVPEFRFGRLEAVTFWTNLETTDRGVTWRHLERHEQGWIIHSLYRSGAADRLGTLTPLESHTDTAWINTLEGGVVTADGMSVAVPTGIDRLTAAYIPNMRPSLWRGRNQLDQLGRSDYHQVEPWFDALDETYAAWMRDIRLAKARIIVPDSMLTNLGPGRGAMFDTDQEIFTGVNALGKPGDGLSLTENQFLIRWEEHQQTARELTAVAMRTAGYSTSSLAGAEPDVAATATEITDRNRLSQRTRDKKTNYWKAGLAHIAAAMLDLDVAVFGAGGGRVAASGLPEVRFQAEVQIDPEKVARTAQSLRVAEAASTETLVRMVHPEWDGETVNKEVARIDDRRGTDVPDPFSITQ